MGIDSMRVGGGRCPPLLVGGLLLACLFLVCNWWTLSSENLELLRQIDELSEQLKISAEDRDQCVTRRGTLEQRYKRTEEEVANLHVRLEQQNALQKRRNELEDSVTICKSELDSLHKLDASKNATLETLRLEKDTINSQLDERKEENRKLQDELEKVQEELNKLKLTLDSPENKKPVVPMKAVSETKLENETLNGVDHEIQNLEDMNDGNEHIDDEMENTDDGLPQEGDRDRQMKVTSHTDKKVD